MIHAMIVSDDEDTAMRLASVLESLNIQADAAHSSLTATAFGMLEQYHLLLIVTGDPQRDIDLCHTVHPGFRGAKILFSPQSDHSHQLAAYAAGADECIPRPIGVLLLRAKIRAWKQRIKKRFDLGSSSG
jgi:DNA-binding response OmpR family regulator